jgi:hypothetical protein
MAKAEPRSITRRSLLSGAAAAVPATVMPSALVAIPAAAPAVAPIAADPIFAAIEAHICAYDEFNAVLDDLAVAEHAAWNAPRGQRRAANKRLAEAYAAERRFGNLETEAVERLVATIPQTLQGAVAALRYVRERFAQGYPMCEEDDFMALLASIEHAICRAGGLPEPSND